MPRLSISICCLLLLASSAGKVRAADGPPPFSYQQLADDYLAGDWTALESSFSTTPVKSPPFRLDQAADVVYMRQVLAECHPAWWAQTKAEKKVPIQTTIWGRTLNVIYDRSIPNEIYLQSNNGQQILSVNWSTADMDNPAPAEHGFSKGDLASLGDWGILGRGGHLEPIDAGQNRAQLQQTAFSTPSGFRASRGSTTARRA